MGLIEKWKICRICKEDFPLTKEYFYKQKGAKDGFRNACITCEKILYYNKERHRKNMLKRRYGITPKQYDEMYDKQYGKCAICGIHQSELKRALSVDHCHKTEKIRGLLCGPCNFNLGWYENCKSNIDLYLKGELL